MTNSVRVFGIRVLSLFVVTFCGITLHAQDANKPTQDHSKESFVVQRILNTVQFENDGTFAIDSKLVVRLQSASGIQAWGLIQVPYASNEGDATIAEVKVTKPNGAVVSTPDEDIQDTPAPITVQAPLYSDLKIKQLAVKGLEIGDTVSYQQSVHVRKPLIPGQFWFARDFFKNGVVLDERLEIRVPKDRYVKVQSPKLAPKITDESGYRVYLWQTANLEHSPEENNSKPEPGKGPLPDVQITSFRGWDEIARWYQQLEASRITPTPEIKARAEEITRDAKSDDEKIRLLYNYVATKFRYIGVDFGIGRYQPHAAAEVLANGYGDCKDKHTLLAALLAVAGVHSDAVLINAARNIDPDVPSPGQFDHVITAIPEGKDLLWLDSTEEVAPAGYLFLLLRDKQALAVPDMGDGRLVHTPSDPPFASSFVFKINGNLGNDSILDAKVDASFRGDVEYALRAAFRSVSQTQWNQVAQAISQSWSFSGTVSEVQISSPEATDAPFALHYTYNRKDYPNWPDVLRPPLPPVNVRKLGDDDKNSEPIRLESPGEYRLEADLNLPKDMVAKPHSTVEISKDFAEYHANYSWQSGVLHVERRLIIHMREIPGTRKDEYSVFWKTLSDDGEVVLAVSSSAPTSEKSSASSIQSPVARANQLLDLGDALFRQGDYDAAIAQFRKALSLRPDDVRAHRTLGDLLFNKNELDGAITEYREALRLNPNDGAAHRSLGNVLFNKNDFDGANTEYREVLRLNPEDSEVHRSLGDVLFNKKDLDGASAEYREALRIDPKDGLAYRGLGDVLWNKNDENGAIEQYRQALRIDPNDANAHRSLGDVFLTRGDAAGAAKEYQELVRLDPSDASAHDSLGEVLLEKQDVDGAMTEYRAALRLKPDDPWAHVGVGNILLGQGHAEQAIDEIKKATAAGSDGPPLAYGLLGRAYTALRRYDEAMDAWKQDKKVSPWDPQAPVAIASLLAQQKRYGDAVTELQSALNDNPKFAEYAPLEFALGRALVRAGEPGKSMTAFQKAVELNSTPMMLNDVSYELADANVHLDSALGYAEQAVAQLEEKAAPIYLANLTLSDFRIMPALAAEWDTLGWVHYRLGQMDQAEKYLSAAWKLAQDPVIGDHLGVIYEKTGKKDQAIRIYKMTLATRHATQETTDRLAALLGSKPTDEAVNAAVDDLMQVRTIKLPRLSKGSAHAEFFIVITSDAGITGVKFISGSEELRSATSAIVSGHYDFAFPENRPMKLVRRGILDCAAVGTSCEFVLIPPESVNSVN